MSKITASTDFDRIPRDQVPRYLSMFAEQVTQALNGNLDATNFNAKLVSVPFGAANTDTAVIHGLSRVPTAYVINGTTAAMSIYDGLTPSTSSVIYLRSSAPGTARILIY